MMSWSILTEFNECWYIWDSLMWFMETWVISNRLKDDVRVIKLYITLDLNETFLCSRVADGFEHFFAPRLRLIAKSDFNRRPLSHEIVPIALLYYKYLHIFIFQTIFFDKTISADRQMNSHSTIWETNK